MPTTPPVDAENGKDPGDGHPPRNGRGSASSARRAAAPAAPPRERMTSFVESCVETVTDSAKEAERRSRGKPRVRHLLRLLGDRKNILVTTHQHPDPDAIASSLALCKLLSTQLHGKINLSIKGRIG